MINAKNVQSLDINTNFFTVENSGKWNNKVNLIPNFMTGSSMC